MSDDESDYEAIRRRNIQQNAELMLSLGLDKSAVRLRSPSPERPARKQRKETPQVGQPSTSKLLPARKSSRIARSEPKSYRDTMKPPRDPERKVKREKVYRQGSRKSDRGHPRPGTGRYKDWSSDDDEWSSDDFASYGSDASQRSDDWSSGDEKRRRIFSPSYRGKRDGSETFVEIPASRGSSLRKIKNPTIPSPPPVIEEEDGIDPVRAPLPDREEVAEGEGRGAIVFEEGYRHFRPNVTPEEMLRGGVFGGTAFRDYYSSVLRRYIDVSAELEELPAEWLEGLDVDQHLRSSSYDIGKNRFGVKAGQSLEDWEKQGWIRTQDPRGWFQWYYRFYLGRRSNDDARQISRWLKACGPAGRFKKMLVQRVAAAGGAWADPAVNSVVRQTLFQWGYELSKADYEAYLQE